MKNVEATTKQWYDYVAEGKVMGKRCKTCGHIEFPPVPICNECGHYDMEWYEMGLDVTMETCEVPTDPRMPMAGFVKFKEGPSWITQLVGIPVEDRAGIPDRLPFEVELVPDQRDGYMWPVARLKGSDWVTGAAPSEVFKAAAPVSDMTGAASETLPKVVECIAKAFGVDAAGIGAETKMVEDLNASSLHLFSLASMLEDEVGKAVAYADIAPLATVGDIAAFLD